MAADNEDRRKARVARLSATELRQLIAEAADFDFDDMTIGALEAGIEAIESLPALNAEIVRLRGEVETMPAWIRDWMAARGLLPEYDDGDGIAESDLIEALNSHERELQAIAPAEAKGDAYGVFCTMDDGRVLRITGYIGDTEIEVLGHVLARAKREGFTGTAQERMAELGWRVEPMFRRTPQPAAGEAVASAVADAFNEITGLCRYLRQGGPDPDDLQGLSDGLEQAIGIAANMLAELSTTPPAAQVQPVCPATDCGAQVLFECPACSHHNYPPREAAQVRKEAVCVRCGDKPAGALEGRLTLAALIEFGRQAANPGQGATRWHMIDLIGQMVPHLETLAATHPAAGDKVRVTDEIAERFGYAMHGEAWTAGAYGIRERYKARYRAALEAIAQPQEADRG